MSPSSLRMAGAADIEAVRSCLQGRTIFSWNIRFISGNGHLPASCIEEALRLVDADLS